MNQEHLTGDAGIQKLGDLIKDIRIAMMTTAAPDGSFDSRPMATQTIDADHPFDGSVLFLTRGESGKVQEIANDSHIALLYADPGNAKYVSAKGRATVYRDQAKIDELWNPMYKAWFPEGQQDPSIAILKVTLDEAQFWEASSSKLVRGVKYLAAAATGGKVQLGNSGTVSL